MATRARSPQEIRASIEAEPRGARGRRSRSCASRSCGSPTGARSCASTSSRRRSPPGSPGSCSAAGSPALTGLVFGRRRRRRSASARGDAELSAAVQVNAVEVRPQAALSVGSARSLDAELAGRRHATRPCTSRARPRTGRATRARLSSTTTPRSIRPFSIRKCRDPAAPNGASSDQGARYGKRSHRFAGFMEV